METLMMTRGDRIPNDIARLKGARFVTAIENEEGRRLKESLVKQLTGGDRMTARFMRGEFFDFVPQCKVFIGVNHKPEVRGTDNAIWERINLIPFGVTIPKPERDKKLPLKLREELSGFLRWCIDGSLLWQREGLGVSREVLGATESYRTEMDVLGSFIEARCVKRPDARVRSADLYSAYKAWCEETNEKPLRQKDFVPRMTERGFEHKKSSVMMWCGIGLLDVGQTG